jgi:hypothetical protein
LFDIPDDGSINGLLMGASGKGKKKGGKKNKISLDV